MEKSYGHNNDSFDQNGTSKAAVTTIAKDIDITVNEKIVPGSKRDPFRFYRFLKQTCIVCIWISIGLYAGIIGPTLPDLRDSIGVDMDQISAVLMCKSAGFLLGAAAGGFLFNVFYRRTELLMLGGVAGMASIAFAPLCQSLGAMCFFFLTAGFSEGIVNVGGNPMVMHIWEEYAATPLLITHFGFGIGSFISPQIAKPFLSTETQHVNETTTVDPTTDGYINHVTGNWYLFPQQRWEAEQDMCLQSQFDETGQESNIVTCYVIVGIMILFVALFQLYFVIQDEPKGYPGWKPTSSLKSMMSPGSCAPQGNKIFGTEILTLLFFFYAFFSGGQSAFADFLFSFARESDLKFSTEQASAVSSTFWVCYTLGRLFGAVIAKWVPVQFLLGVAISICLAIGTILSLFAEQNEVVFWVFTCLYGFTMSLLFPSGMAWSNMYLNMNSMSTMILLMGSSTGRMPFQYMAGFVYDEYGPNYIMYVSTAGYFLCLGVFVVMQNIASCNGTKYDHEVEGDNQDHAFVLYVHHETKSTKM